MSIDAPPTDADIDIVAGPDARAERPILPLWRLVLRRPQAVICLILVLVIVGAVALAPIVSPYSPMQQDLLATLQGPSAAHWLGTDDLGRDVLSRILHGGSTTLLGVVQALIVFVVVGTLAGLAAGMSRGVLDTILTRAAEVLLSVPSFIVILVMLSILPGNMTVAMITIGVLTSPLLMRVVRGSTKAVRNDLYIVSARSMGLTEAQITMRHVLPRLAGPIIVQATIFSGAVIMTETGLSYLGFGTRLPAPSWGNIVQTASENITRQPWLLVPSGAIIIITVMSLMLLGDSLRDAVAERWTGSSPAPARRRIAAAARASRATPSASPTADVALRVEGLTIVVDSADGERDLVRDVSFDVLRGETMCIVGESGSGKSITALSVLGISRGPRIAEGRIWVGETEISGLSGSELARVRGSRFGYITQDPQPSLDPSMRVGDLLAQLVALHQGCARAEARRRANELLARVRIPDPEAVARRFPHQLSGGMAQRVVIAAALSAEPDVLIADEPTTALDVTVQAEILSLLHGLCESERSMSLLLITHDWGVVADIADRVAVMHRGGIVETASVEQIFASPQHAHTRAMLEHEPARQARRATDATASVQLLEVDDLRIEYAGRDARGRKVRVEAVRGISLSVGAGRTLGIVGESGSGKSSVGNAIAGLVPAEGGRIRFDGEDLIGISAARRRELTGDIQMIFQDPYGSLNPVRTIGATLEEPLVLAHGVARSEARRRVASALERVGLDESAARRYPSQFSGGQRQRIAIARALVLEPRLIVCDEAVSALDLAIQAQVLDLLAELQRDTGIAYVFISHDLSVVRNFCDDIAIMHRGVVVESGPTERVCDAPEHPYTRGLLAAAPIPDPEVQHGRSKLVERYLG